MRNNYQRTRHEHFLDRLRDEPAGGVVGKRRGGGQGGTPAQSTSVCELRREDGES